MKRRILLALVTVVLLLSVVLTGCSSGVPQADYDNLAAQLADAQSKLADIQSQLAKSQEDYLAADNNYRLEMDRVAGLTLQIDLLKAQYEFVGLSTAEIAAQIIKNYHETHTYSVTDLFVCGDMAAEVWNLLKTQGINALMVVGDIQTPITDIALSGHAWVLAEIAPGEYLALETTGGNTVSRSQNPLYYRGWTFQTPADIKTYQQLIVEYNTGVKLRNAMAIEDNSIITLYNNSMNQQEADQWLAVHDELTKLITQQETDLNGIRAEFEALATALH